MTEQNSLSIRFSKNGFRSLITNVIVVRFLWHVLLARKTKSRRRKRRALMVGHHSEARGSTARKERGHWDTTDK